VRWPGWRHWRSNVNRVADRVEDSASARAGSSVHAEIAYIRRRRNRLFAQVCDGVWNRWGLQQLSIADVRGMNPPLSSRWRRGRRRWHENRRFVEPLQLGGSLSHEEGNQQQQTQSKALHGEGYERGPSPTGREVPGAFPCAAHN